MLKFSYTFALYENQLYKKELKIFVYKNYLNYDMSFQNTTPCFLTIVAVINSYSFQIQFLNQSHRPVGAWFLEIDPVWIVGMRICVCMCVSPRLRLLITSSVL